MAERLVCSQSQDLGLMCREKRKVLHNRVTEKRSSYYINNCLLLNPKGRAIKPLTTKIVAKISLHFDVYCDRLMFSSPPFYSITYSAENHASVSGFK